MRRVDRALAGLLVCVFLVGAASALATPISTRLDYGHDERWHLAIIQTLVEHGKLYGDGEGNWTDPRSTEQRTAEAGSGIAPWAIGPRVHPLWTAAAERRWGEQDARLGPEARADGRGRNPVRHLPPGYHVAVAGPYALAPGSWLDRALLVRLLSVLMAVVTTALSWRLARVVGLPRTGALLCAGVVGLNPQAVQLAGVVNPDNLLLPLWTAALLAGTLLLLRGFTWPRMAAFVLALAALPLVKQTGLLLLPAAVFVVVVMLRRHGDRRLNAAAVATGVLLVLGFVVADQRLGYNFLESVEDPLGFPGYLLQFWTPLARPFDGAPRWEVTRLVAVDRNVAASLAPAALGLLTAWAAVRVLPSWRQWPRSLLLFHLLAAAGLVAGLLWISYDVLAARNGAFAEPRYFAPLVPAVGLLLGAAVSRLPQRARDPAAAAVLALCAGSSVAWVLTRAEIAYA